MEDLISVIVPVYNVEPYLKKCIESILQQTYKNIEILLVDDGSPDNCGKICDNYAKKDKRIKVIHKQNGGLSDARNAALEIMKGNYVTLIDSDDWVENDYIEKLYNKIIEYNADLSACAYKVIYENGNVIDNGINKDYIWNKKEALEHLLYRDIIDVAAWGKLYKAKLFIKIRYPKGRLFEDAATTYRLIDQSDRIVFCSVSKYNYYIRKNSITTEKFNPKKMDLITSTKEMTDYIKKEYPDLEDAANNRLMYAYLSTLTQLAKGYEKKYDKYKKKLNSYIKNNRKEILKNHKISSRNRIALYCTIFGFNFFKISWKIYENITKRC